jgi:hypothetical protein
MANTKTRTKYTSKNERPSVAKVNRVETNPFDKVINKFGAYIKGKKSFITIDNPDTTQTNKRKIRIPYNQLTEILYDWRKAQSGYFMK